MMRTALLATLLACAEAAAQGRILVAPLPADLDPARIIELAGKGLAACGWIVDANAPGSVAARRDSIRIRVFLDPGILRYEALRGSIPEARVVELRGDLTAALGPVSFGAPTGKALAGYVPPGTEPSELMDTARFVFAARRWVISGTGDVITARLTTARAEATLVAFMTSAGLQYADEGDIPPNWIANIRSDIPRYLRRHSASRTQMRAVGAPREPATPGPAAQPQRAGAAERLRALKELFDSGTISRDEYDKKRVEILKDL